MKILLFASVLYACFVNSATSSAFKGAYLGGLTGLVLSNTKSSFTNVLATSISKSTGASTKANKNSTGLLYGIYGGYGLTLNDHYYVGGEISVLGDTAKHTMNLSVVDPGSGATYNVSSNYKRGFTFGAAPPCRLHI
jgi:hypothetical protein